MRKLHTLALVMGLMAIAFLLPGFFSPLEAQSQTFSSDGMFVVPPGVTMIQVECWGGGGRGGSRDSNEGAGGGGGGGAYSRKNAFSVSPGDVFAVVVGLGSNNGTLPGGDSRFYQNINSIIVLAEGGNSVPDNISNGASGGSSGNGIGDVRHSGGNGANGLFDNYGGGGGSSAGTYSNGTNGNLSLGGIAPSGGGNGGDGSTGPNGDGVSGAAPGGGGGGAITKGGGNDRNGGAGANGMVKVSWGTALPVTWLSFRAVAEGEDVKLTWSTASESNNEGFGVQRSENGRDWQPIGFVEAAGTGTSSEVQTYSFTDNTLSTLNSQLAYYRLEQRDFDGTTDYSPIRVIQLSTTGGIRVYPNPANEVATIAFGQPTEARGWIRLLNGNGRLLAEHTIPIGTTAYELRVAQLPAGAYLLEIKVGGKEWMRRLVVE